MRTAVVGLAGLFSCTLAQTSSVTLNWIDGTPDYLAGTTFGVPWPRGQHPADTTTFSATGDASLQSWVTAYWPDGSLKWTGHALGATESPLEKYTITATSQANTTSRLAKRADGIQVSDSSDKVVVDTGKITATFPKSGNVLVSSLQAGGKTVGTNGHLVLRSQTGTPDDDSDGKPTGIEYFTFTSKISNVTVSGDNSARTLVTVNGIHTVQGGGAHADWLPFAVRFYLYANSEAVRIIHTIIYDGDMYNDFLSGIGIRFDVPLAKEELYNRHVRIAGVDGGILHEAVKGITGLRRDPGAEIRSAQYNGTVLPDPSTWDQRVTTRLQVSELDRECT